MEKGLKKEKQPWQSQRCFPGCVLEVVCLIRRLKYGKVAQVRKILDLGDILVFYSRLPATQETSL
jgi:hypothetical protein